MNVYTAPPILCESCEQRPWVYCLVVEGDPFAVCEDCA